MATYKDCKKIIWVSLDKEKAEEVKKFNVAYTAAKADERARINDDKSIDKRNDTGHSSEAALEAFLGVEFRDTSITVGNSRPHGGSDMKKIGIDCDIKSVTVGNQYPLIKKQNKIPVIICIKDKDKIGICGIASTKVLNDPKNQDRNKVLVRNVPSYKTAFTGYDQLESFNSLEELKKVIAKLEGKNVLTV